MIGRRQDIHQLGVHLRTLQTHVGSGLIVRYLIIESGQFRNLDELAVTLLHNNLSGHVDLIVTRLTGEDGSPGIKRVDVLLAHSLGTQVLEQQIQLRERVADSRAGKERRAKVTA